MMGMTCKDVHVDDMNSYMLCVWVCGCVCVCVCACVSACAHEYLSLSAYGDPFHEIA